MKTIAIPSLAAGPKKFPFCALIRRMRTSHDTSIERSGQACVPIIFGASQTGQIKKDWDLGVCGVWG